MRAGSSSRAPGNLEDSQTGLEPESSGWASATSGFLSGKYPDSLQWSHTECCPGLREEGFQIPVGMLSLAFLSVEVSQVGHWQQAEPRASVSWGLFSLGPHPRPLLSLSGRTGQTDENLPKHRLLLK